MRLSAQLGPEPGLTVDGTYLGKDTMGWGAGSSISYFAHTTGYPTGGQANQKAVVDVGSTQNANYYPGLEDEWSPGFTVPAARSIDATSPDADGGTAGSCGRNSQDVHQFDSPWDHRVMTYHSAYAMLNFNLLSSDELMTHIEATASTDIPGDGNEMYSYRTTDGYVTPECTLSFTGAADAARLSGSIKVYGWIANDGTSKPPAFAWGTDPVAAGWVQVGTGTTDASGIDGGTDLALDDFWILDIVPVAHNTIPRCWLLLVGQDAFADPTIATGELDAADTHNYAFSWTDWDVSLSWFQFYWHWAGGEYSDAGPGRELGTYLAAWQLDADWFLSSVRPGSPAQELSRLAWPFGDATAGVEDPTGILAVSRPEGRSGQLLYLLMTGLDDPSEPVTNGPVIDTNPPPSVNDPAPIGTTALQVSTTVTVTRTPTIQDLSYVTSAT